MLAHLRLLEGDHGGFAVDRFEHSLQTATRAREAGKDDEYVVVRAERESTWSADSFRGFATSQGVTTAVEMVHIWRLVDSKIVEHWAVRDDLGLMMQLGVVEAG